MRDATQTTLDVYWDQKGWRFRTVNQHRQIGDTSVLYESKTKCLRDAKRWHPGVPVTIRPKEDM